MADMVLELAELRSVWTLPIDYADYSNVVAAFAQAKLGEHAVLLGQVHGSPTRKFGPPRTQFVLIDRAGNTVQIALFGDQCNCNLQDGEHVAIYGQLSTFNDTLSMGGAVVARADVGKVKARYQAYGRGANREAWTPPTAELASLIERSAAWASRLIGTSTLKNLLAVEEGACVSRLVKLLHTVHQPESTEDGVRARAALETIAAAATLTSLKTRGQPLASFILDYDEALRDLEFLSCGLPFEMTSEQRKACIDSIEDMACGESMKRLLQGEVGSGKTATFGTVAALTALQKGAVGILCPTQPLAEQVYAELSSYWPEVEFRLIRASDKQRVTPWPGIVFIGTTALFAQLDGALDLVISDEQHKYSAAQRERLANDGGHKLEVSGTCIPRSLALTMLGHQSVSELRAMHCNKVLHTYLVQSHQRRKLFQHVKDAVAADEKVLVVCAKREDASVDDRGAVMTAAQFWERNFPGKVQILHGQMSDVEKTAALDALRSGAKPILVTTSVIEVGITIPGLRWMMILDPDRFGLVQLHQLRGRLARHGGHGFCFLYKAERLSEEAQERLSVFCSTTDGFALAEADLKLRGAGDLVFGSKQHGGTPSPLFPEKQYCRLEAILKAAEKLAA